MLAGQGVAQELVEPPAVAEQPGAAEQRATVEPVAMAELPAESPTLAETLAMIPSNGATIE